MNLTIYGVLVIEPAENEFLLYTREPDLDNASVGKYIFKTIFEK